MEMANALPEAGRKPTNVSLNTALVAEEQGRRWKQENAESMAAWNAWAESGELPLRRHRQF
jgi:post-segregation antitoxin (ccd killing protein)